MPACGGQTLITFAPFTATVLGRANVRVSVPDDQDTANDSEDRILDVNLNQYSYKYPGSGARDSEISAALCP